LPRFAEAVAAMVSGESFSDVIVRLAAETADR
jgi:hypothetical protein